MPRALVLIGLALCIALAVASVASGEGLIGAPTAYGTAERGAFTVTSSALVFEKSVDQRGGWFDGSISCRQKRLLHVRAFLGYQPETGPPRRVVRTTKARPRNCAEGGPNLGFTILARKNNLACHDGSWLPGTYTLTTRTTHRRTKLRAIAVLIWTNSTSCTSRQLASPPASPRS